MDSEIKNIYRVIFSETSYIVKNKLIIVSFFLDIYKHVAKSHYTNITKELVLCFNQKRVNFELLFKNGNEKN